NCAVLGIEIDEAKISLAKKLGITACINPREDDIDAAVNNLSNGKGADAVIITAASRNNLPIEMAGKIVRDKGRVILVGAMPIIIPRREYYEKELYFVISRGFGAGLYFPVEKNRSYGYNYKPITVKENMKNFLTLLARKKIKVEPLISHRFTISGAKQAYELISGSKEKYLGIIFEYNKEPLPQKKILLSETRQPRPINIGFIGAGSFAQGYLLPVFKKIKDVNLAGVATASGISAKNVARKFGFAYAATDYKQILDDNDINCVVIATRHNLHGELVVETLKKDKSVFVEKPLCLNEDELKRIIATYNAALHPTLMVGFNRRFSPFIQETKRFFKNRSGPLIIDYRVNAGYLPFGHWVYNSEGGGRIIGEMCHFVDLMQYLTGVQPVEVSAVSLDYQNKNIFADNNVLITLRFADGSMGTINYNSIGDIAFPRERIEIFGENSVAVIDNFKNAVFSRAGMLKKIKKITRDMGHNDEIKSFVKSVVNNQTALIPFNELVLTTLTTFKIIESLKKKCSININIDQWIEN
ncbi:MAG: Gfo/Idh/MocA family oxidoreductase, partial [Candidatus Omnitrophota bacterium]